MRDHTSERIFDLSGPGGDIVTLVPGASTPSVKYLFSALPTGKGGKFWYYMTALMVALTITIHPAAGEGNNLELDEAVLYNIIQSLQVYSPVLGLLYTHNNTRGVVMGNIIQKKGFGYSNLGTQGFSADTGVNTRTIYMRIPFSFENLKKPHETAPWTGFMEGGDLTLIIANSASYNPFNNVVGEGDIVWDSLVVRCAMAMVPAPEACIHTPCHFREHSNLPASKKLTITDMGSPDGLTGINMGKGVGIASLWYETNALGNDFANSEISAGGLLGGATSAANFATVEMPWRDQTVTKYPDFLVLSALTCQGSSRRNVTSGLDIVSGFPYLNAPTIATPTSLQQTLANNDLLVFPLVADGRDLETSKLQTVGGAKDINLTYVNPTIVTAPPVLLGQYFPVFDDTFINTVLVPRIDPTKATGAKLTAKTLNKQVGGIPGIGKLAYVRRKIVQG